MRVAVCMSGLTRGSLFCLPFLREHIIKPLNADVFMHTWDIDVGGGGSADRFLDASNVWRDPQAKMEFFDKEAEKHNYFFSSCMDAFDDKSWNFAGAAEANNVVPMTYSIYKSNALKKKKEKKENFTYDLVIRTRMDTMYEEEIPSQEIEEVISTPDKVFVRFNGINRGNTSPRNKFIFEGDGSPFVADNFSFSSSKVMDICSDLYLNLNRYFSESINPCPEVLLGNHLKKEGVAPEWSKMQFMSMIEWTKDEAVFEKHYDERERKAMRLA
jgi:hypothetical protein